MDLVIILIVLAGGLMVIAFLLNKKLSELSEKQQPPGELLQVIQMLQEGSQKDRKVLVESLQKNSQALNERLDNAARVINQVQRHIGEMSEIGRSMKELQEFLSSPKLRGNMGEQVLKELLQQFLPKQSFHLQYAFKSGEKVDAAIKTAAGIIPIDSKFPLENFRKMMSSNSQDEKKIAERQFARDVKKHIKTISEKYILTEEGTIDYALMYLPSETVYYEVVNNSSLFEYGAAKRVLPVSPTTFYAYLRAILMSFEGQKIELKTKEVLQAIRAIQRDYNQVGDKLSILQRHLNNAYNMMNNVYTAFTKLGQKITSTQSLSTGVGEKRTGNE